MKIPFVSFKPMEREFATELKYAFERVFNRSWYIEGEEDATFEKAFAEFCNTKFCIGVGNGLDALMLALKALSIGNGDEVNLYKYREYWLKCLMAFSHFS